MPGEAIGLSSLGEGLSLCGGEQVDDGSHLGLDEGGEIRLHPFDFLVEGQFRKAVFFQLLKLHFEDAGDEFAGEGAGFLLGVLLLPQGAGIESGGFVGWLDRGVRGGRGLGRVGGEEAGCQERQEADAD